jgi:hypothetical protein
MLKKCSYLKIIRYVLNGQSFVIVAAQMSVTFKVNSEHFYALVSDAINTLAQNAHRYTILTFRARRFVVTKSNTNVQNVHR